MTGSLIKKAGIVLCSVLIILVVRCRDNKHNLTLVESWDTASIEQDIEIIPSDKRGNPFFIQGFLAPGDSGRALKHRNADIDLYSVSRCDKTVDVELTIPMPGGHLAILGPGKECVFEGDLPGGMRHIRFPLPSDTIMRGRNRIRFRWNPNASDDASPRRLVVRRIRIQSTDPKECLSFVSLRVAENRLIMGDGCRVEVYVERGRDAFVRGSVSGVGGIGRITMCVDGEEPDILWDHELSERPRPFRVALDRHVGRDLIAVSFEILAPRGEATWDEITFIDAQVPHYSIAHESISTGPLAPTEKPYNVILYLIDTIRRDRLQIYGYERSTTPGLLGSLREWDVWDDCRSLSSWTKASTATLLTGLDPVCHGALDDDDSLAADIGFVWDSFADAGYETAFLSTNAHISRQWGFARNVDHYMLFRESKLRRKVHFPADSLHLSFLHWVDNRIDKARPFFAYLHATDPHIPYTPRPEFLVKLYPEGIPRRAEMTGPELMSMICPGRYKSWEVQSASALYDAEIAGWDADFSHLLDSLAVRGLLDRTIVVLTSDHGEEFAEHGGFSHGTTLYSEQLDVPLLARIPGQGGGKSNVVLDHRDIGDLLRWVAEGNDASAWRPKERSLRIAHLSLRAIEIARIDDGQFSLIWNISPVRVCDGVAPQMELYAYGTGEIDDMTDGYQVLCGAGRGALESWVRRLSLSHMQASRLDERLSEQLRLLGYLTDE